MVKNKIIIRRACGRDFLPIAALDREAWRENRNSEFIPDGEHVWRIWVDQALVYCAVDEGSGEDDRGGRIVGAVLAFPCLDGSFNLHKVFVDRSCRGLGVGSRLFGALLEEIDRLGVDVHLTVDPVNAAAIRLYESWGFERGEVHRGYYRDNEDRYVMVRKVIKQ